MPKEAQPSDAQDSHQEYPRGEFLRRSAGAVIGASYLGGLIEIASAQTAKSQGSEARLSAESLNPDKYTEALFAEIGRGVAANTAIFNGIATLDGTTSLYTAIDPYKRASSVTYFLNIEARRNKFAAFKRPLFHIDNRGTMWIGIYEQSENWWATVPGESGPVIGQATNTRSWLWAPVDKHVKLYVFDDGPRPSRKPVPYLGVGATLADPNTTNDVLFEQGRVNDLKVTTPPTYTWLRPSDLAGWETTTLVKIEVTDPITRQRTGKLIEVPVGVPSFEPNSKLKSYLAHYNIKPFKTPTADQAKKSIKQAVR